MTPARGIALDANILIRAVLGIRVYKLLRSYEDSIVFYTPDICFDEARKHLPKILTNRGSKVQSGLAVLDQIRLMVQPVKQVAYRDFEELARERMATRDIDDWPIVAVALMFDIPIWTEDRDFFGSGIATWTTDRVELYLQGRHA